MTNFRKKLVNYYNYFKENMVMNLLLIFMGTLSFSTFAYGIYFNNTFLAYLFIVEITLTLLLSSIPFSELKSIKGNILKILKDSINVFLTTIFIFTISICLMSLCIIASTQVISNNLNVTKFSSNISFMLSILLGIEGLTLFFTINIILVYRVFRKMNIWKSIYYSKKFIRKRIFTHLLSCVGVMFLLSPFLYLFVNINKPAFLSILFLVIYIYILFNFAVFDIKSELEYVDLKIREDSSKKKGKKSFIKEMKDLYNSEKESVVKRLMERKKINNKNTSKKAGSNARMTKNKTKNK